MRDFTQPDKTANFFDYRLAPNGVFMPEVPVIHRDDEYDPAGFAILWEMQLRHFWYLGRHRFLLQATKQALGKLTPRQGGLKLIDLGAGCGGWIKYLMDRRPAGLSEIALGDSSLMALEKSIDILPPGVARYQIDLLRLGWRERWDVVYLLDVLEHLPEDKPALSQVAAAMKPGALAFVTMPALDFFWSYNDEVANHCRRYNAGSLTCLAEACGLQVLSARYFMFFLSPLLWLSRARYRNIALTQQQKMELMVRAHRIPASPVNKLLGTIFAAESPLGHYVKFPWGTSILGILQKPGALDGPG